MERFANATVEVAGIKVRGTVKSLDTGGSKKTGVVNGDGSTDASDLAAMLGAWGDCV